MKWSRYNLPFCSARFGYFVYNALSNVFIELDAEHYRELERLRDQSQMASGMDETFLAFLREEKIIVAEGEDEIDLNNRHLQRQALSADNKQLCLTICPTLGCNFRCRYCFEQSQRSKTVMSPETIDRLVSFIRGFRDACTWRIRN